MRLLFYGINYAPDLTGVGKYTSDMVRWFAHRGHQCRVITGIPYYPLWTVPEPYRSFRVYREDDQGIEVYRCPIFVPARPTLFRRILHLASFMVTSLPVLLSQIRWRPEAVVVMAPTFFVAPQALLLTRLTGARSWLHFQDFEICAMFGSGLARGQVVCNRVAHRIQRFFCLRFDRISTISGAMLEKAERSAVSRSPIVLFPNWSDPHVFEASSDPETTRASWAIQPSDTLVLYSGSLGHKQGLQLILETAQLLKNEKDIIFLVIGDGPTKDRLTRAAAEHRISNLRFHSLLPTEDYVRLLRAADIHLVIQKAGAADAVFPSKLSNIFAVGGQAIVTTHRNTELGRLLSRHPGIATEVPPDNAPALAHAITGVRKAIRASSRFNRIALEYAAQHLNSEAILTDFERNLRELVSE